MKEFFIKLGKIMPYPVEQAKEEPEVTNVQLSECSECKSPITYNLGLCEKCYGELFEIAKGNDEVSKS